MAAGPVMRHEWRARYLPPSVSVTLAFCQDAPLVSASPSAARAFSARSFRQAVPSTGLLEDLPVGRDLDRPVERRGIGDPDPVR